MDLPEPDLQVLRAVASGPEACRRTAVIGWELGLGHDCTERYLRALEDRGLLDCWRPTLNPRLELWTLSPLGAELLHVHLVETGVDELWRWNDDGSDPPPARQLRDPGLDGHPYPDPGERIVTRLGLEVPRTPRPRRRGAGRPCTT